MHPGGGGIITTGGGAIKISTPLLALVEMLSIDAKNLKMPPCCEDQMGRAGKKSRGCSVTMSSLEENMMKNIEH